MKSPITYTLTFIADDGTVEYPEVARLREAVAIARAHLGDNMPNPTKVYREVRIPAPPGAKYHHTVGLTHMWLVDADSVVLTTRYHYPFAGRTIIEAQWKR